MPRPAAPDGITLRTATEDTLEAILLPLQVAFGEPWTAEDLDYERRVVELDRVIGAFDGDTPVGASGALPYRLTTPGGEVGAAGITLVGVLPTHRRRGILRMMMTDLFETAAVRGEPVAVLWASEAAIYQAFGYGVATFQSTIDAPSDRIRLRAPSELEGRSSVRLLERDAAVEPCSTIYEVHRRRVPGSLSRRDIEWRGGILAESEALKGSDGAKHRAVLEVDGEPRAYAVYRLKPDWTSSGPQSVVSVLELIGLDPAAESALWGWLLSIDLVRVVRMRRGPTPHPLALAITEPRRLNVTVSDGTWLRILDVPGALAGRTYHGPGSLVLELTDDFLPANAGRWRLTVPGSLGSSAAVERVSDGAAPDLSLDISALAATYLGTVRFGDLARAGRIIECRPGALAEADALWASSVTPYNSTMF